MAKWQKVLVCVGLVVGLLGIGFALGRYFPYRFGSGGAGKPAVDLADGIGKLADTVDASAGRIDEATELAGYIAKRLVDSTDSAAVIAAASERAAEILAAAQARGDSGSNRTGGSDRSGDMEVEDE